jgi:hypothetical protein
MVSLYQMLLQNRKIHDAAGQGTVVRSVLEERERLQDEGVWAR